MKRFFFFIIFVTTAVLHSMHSQKLKIYTLGPDEGTKKDNLAFTSLSDDYMLSEHSDSLAVPSMEGKEESDFQYFQLDQLYRNRFLTKMKISEKDLVYIYDYLNAVLKSFRVSDLPVVAVLSPYGGEWPYSQYDYMIGFGIPVKSLPHAVNYFAGSLVYVGKKSPFVLGKLNPVKWRKIRQSEFPSAPIKPEDLSTLTEMGAIKGDVYTYDLDGLNYYIQEYEANDKRQARRMLVLKSKTKKVVCERFYFSGESSGLAPLNYIDRADDVNQWTGKLFRNKPPVIFGLEFTAFGCPAITLLKQSEEDIYINCDNRH